MRIKSVHQQRVEELMRLCRQNVPDIPVMPDEKTRKLRANLILEEALETIRDLGFNPVLEFSGDKKTVSVKDVALIPTGCESLQGIADGCADVIVVTTGTLSACGMSDVAIQEEVDNNNLTKFGPGHYWREDGKLIKPPNHTPPDIKKVLEDQGFLG